MQTGTETECTNESLLNQKFAKGEKVFCFNGPFFYEAKILQCELTDDKNFEYYVHYIGWNNYSDEWVPEDRILKYNENNASKEKKRCGAISEESKHETSDDRNAEKRDCSHKEAAIHCSSVESPASAPPRTDDASSELMTSMKADQFGSKKENSPRKGVERVGGFAFNLEENFSNNVTIQTFENVRGKSSGVHDTTNTINSTVVPVLAPAKMLPPPPLVKMPVRPRKLLPISLLNTAPSLMRNENNSLGSSAEDLEMWFLTKMEIKIKMPNELKERLADDWEAINEQSKLLNIPSRITAQDVVDQYIASKSSRKSVRPSTDTIIAEVMSGIIEYFNVMLGTRILYNFEKQQYRGILQKYPNTPLSQLYGATHLLRLLANLDSVLTLSALDKQHIKTILRYLHDFLKFLVRNTSIYFSMSNFIKASPQHFHVDQEK